MLRTLVGAPLLTGGASAASAHEIWLQRDGEQVAIYVGDATGDRDQGEDIAGQKVASLQNVASLSFVGE